MVEHLGSSTTASRCRSRRRGADKLLAKTDALERALLDKKGRLPKRATRTVAIAEAAVRLNPLIELLRAGQEWHAEQAQAQAK